MLTVNHLLFYFFRSPFRGHKEYHDRKMELLRLSLEIATCAQRDRFAERPVEEIRCSCKKLAELADGIIQDIMDPLVLQPASLDLATLKKRAGDDLVTLHNFPSNNHFFKIIFFLINKVPNICVLNLEFYWNF